MWPSQPSIIYESVIYIIHVNAQVEPYVIWLMAYSQGDLMVPNQYGIWLMAYSQGDLMVPNQARIVNLCLVKNQ